jgi:hypothetical protein
MLKEPMPRKPHLYFHNPQEGVTTYKQRSRYPERPEEEENDIKDYTPKSEDFIRSIASYYDGKRRRETSRNVSLRVPAKVDYIKITFHNIFQSDVFENSYRTLFGLSCVRYTSFNTIGLFAVIDEGKFDNFIEQLRIFIDTTNHADNPQYNPIIKFIREFTFYSSEQIIQYSELKEQIVIDLIDNVDLFTSHLLPIENRLIEYLDENDVRYFKDRAIGKIELFGVTQETIQEIADNFDNIQSINSHAAGLVKPSVFNLPERSYGFTISNATADLPIIGIIDTGISNQTPLRDLIVNQDNTLNITGSPVTEDATNHGTAVATLAALGKKLYPNHIGTYEADAKLLSIKILDGQGSVIPEIEVVRLIREAHNNYGVQIFTLTVSYQEPLLNNKEISEYAFALDKLCYELNILIFISIGNINDLSYLVRNPYPTHFSNEEANLFSPAESMNNITIGASASNLENNDQLRISPAGSVPAIYTRKFHINWKHEAMLFKNGRNNFFRTNKNLFKPDVCYEGGEYDNDLNHATTGLKIVSTEPGIFFDRSIGTSYATPLAANLAARIIKTYPELRNSMQTVKALIINSAQDNELGTSLDNIQNTSVQSIFGHGVPSDDIAIFSSDERVTCILEDTIIPGEVKSFTINIPQYFLNATKKVALLKVKATLCFKFSSLKHHHIAYCPIHIAFIVCRNRPLESHTFNQTGKRIATGINENKISEIAFGPSWSQDYYYKPKMLSNVQNVQFNISKDTLQEEDCTLKIAVNTKLHKLLSRLDQDGLKSQAIQFSIVFTIEENLGKNEPQGRLYDELVAINSLDAVISLDALLEATGEAG